jgi:hypothetical protein
MFGIPRAQGNPQTLSRGAALARLPRVPNFVGRLLPQVNKRNWNFSKLPLVTVETNCGGNNANLFNRRVGINGVSQLRRT